MRGLCGATCYPNALHAVKRGKATWEELVAAGKALPPRPKGGSLSRSAVAQASAVREAIATACLRCGCILRTCRGEEEMRAEARAILEALEAAFPKDSACRPGNEGLE